MKKKLPIFIVLASLIYGCGEPGKEEKPSTVASNASSSDFDRAPQAEEALPDASESSGRARAEEAVDDIDIAGENDPQSEAMEAATSWAKKAWEGYSQKSEVSEDTTVSENPAPVDDKVGGALGSILDNDVVVRGLKEALAKGVEKSVAILSSEDGFFANPEVKIELPDKLDPLRKGLKAIGREEEVDSFVLTMNRAAESAIGEVIPIFANSVREMSVTDAISILNGKSDEATQYFKRTSSDSLYEKILPIVSATTEKTGVTAQYKNLTGRLGFAGKLIKSDALDLDGYITRKALDGLFAAIANEEKMIRERPAERTSELLKKVFGWVGD